jgi:hypothetical protein
VIAPAITNEKTRGDNFKASINTINSFLETQKSKKKPAEETTSEKNILSMWPF